MRKNDFLNHWSRLHGNAQISGVVKAWLSISFIMARVLCKLKISANLLTISGLLFAALLYLFGKEVWSPIFLVLSLMADGIDGSMAIISGKASKFGSLLDSVVDRISEVLWVLVLYKIGIDQEVLLFIIITAFIQEYLRSRSGGLGLTDIGIVTIAERPVRASFVFIILIFFHLNFANIIFVAYLWMIFQIVSIITITKYLRSKFR
jgi:phosphatidylglycerophosphate synthase